jgi:serine/threonine protein kinase
MLPFNSHGRSVTVTMSSLSSSRNVVSLTSARVRRSFGSVFKAVRRRTRELVALKQIDVGSALWGVACVCTQKSVGDRAEQGESTEATEPIGLLIAPCQRLNSIAQVAGEDVDQIIKEIEIMKEIKSPYIVRYFGNYFHSNRYALELRRCVFTDI